MKHSLLAATSLATITYLPTARKPVVGALGLRRGLVVFSLASAVVAGPVNDASAVAIYTTNALGPIETAAAVNSSSTVSYTDAIGNVNNTATTNYTLVGSTASRTYAVTSRAGTNGTTTFTYSSVSAGKFQSSINGTSLATGGSTLTVTTTVTPTARTGSSIAGTFTLVGKNATTTNYSGSVDYNTANAAQTTNITFQTTPVAPIASVTATTSATTLRVGTSATATATVVIQNTGDGNKSGVGAASNLRGTVSSNVAALTTTGGGAVDLADSASQTYKFTYAPTTRQSTTATVTAALVNGKSDGSNTATSSSSTVAVTAVGPVYDAALKSGGAVVNGGTIRFGNIAGGVTLQELLISNATPDAGAKSLTDLTLTSIDFTSNTGNFSLNLSGFDTQTQWASGGTVGKGVLHSAANTKNIGDIDIQFGATTQGYYTGQLRIQTDENASLGGAGTVYVYNLVGTVPEPGTLMVLGTGLLGLAMSRRRLGRNVPAALIATTASDDQR